MNPSQVLLAAASKGAEANDGGSTAGVLALMGLVALGGVILLLGSVKGGGSWKTKVMEFIGAGVAFVGVALIGMSFLGK